MLIAHTPSKLYPQLDRLRFEHGKRASLSLVTTRGAMHDGHGALIHAAATISDHVIVAKIPDPDPQDGKIVSAEEFQDLSFSDRHRADVVYAPLQATLFPDGRASAPELNMPLPLSDLEYDSLALITHLKIINTIQPEIIVWGERNFIEYVQVRSMIEALSLRVQLHCIPTVRHANGTAVSGTDELLNVQQKQAVPVIHQTLQNVAHVIRSGGRNYENIRRTARTALQGAGFEIEYFTILDDQTLLAPTDRTTSFRFICRVTLDGIPMVDGMSLGL